MSTNTLIWLLPVVFILHDFEEILLGPVWIKQHGDTVTRRFPFTRPVIERYRRLSVPGFVMAVLFMFVLVLMVTLVSAEFQLYNLWAAAVTVLLLHFIVHIGQFIVFGAYVPVIVTSVPGAVWCVAVLVVFWGRGLLEAGAVGLWAAVSVVAVCIWFLGAHKIGVWFDNWLRKTYPLAFTHDNQ